MNEQSVQRARSVVTGVRELQGSNSAAILAWLVDSCGLADDDEEDTV